MRITEQTTSRWVFAELMLDSVVR